jgi:hypothetical protein
MLMLTWQRQRRWRFLIAQARNDDRLFNYRGLQSLPFDDAAAAAQVYERHSAACPRKWGNFNKWRSTPTVR